MKRHPLPNSKKILLINPYQPGLHTDELIRQSGKANVIKMASNENPLGPSPQALKAAMRSLENINIYPDSTGYALKAALANFYGLDTHNIILGNGSENILEIIAKAFLSAKDNAVVSQYCFATILLVIQMVGANIKVAPASNFCHNIDNIIAALDLKTRVVFIVNPNNPTGTYITHTDMVKLLNSINRNTLVVVDEAYYEYVSKKDFPNTLSLLASYPNLIIVRTFSKIYGISGLRMGYAISHPAIVEVLDRIRLPFNVNSVAMAAAGAALDDREHVRKSYLLNLASLRQLKSGLNKMNLEVIPSAGNFICVNVKRDAMDIYQQLLHRGIIVRPLLSYNLPFHLRITSGTCEQNEILLTVLQNILLDAE